MPGQVEHSTHPSPALGAAGLGMHRDVAAALGILAPGVAVAAAKLVETLEAPEVVLASPAVVETAVAAGAAEPVEFGTVAAAAAAASRASPAPGPLHKRSAVRACTSPAWRPAPAHAATWLSAAKAAESDP